MLYPLSLLLQCIEDADFQVGVDPCMTNPALCPRGLSVALFYKGQEVLDHRDLARAPEAFPRKYLLSTGGARGFPGVGIFIAGPYLG
jgi:hypothetical protein